METKAATDEEIDTMEDFANDAAGLNPNLATVKWCRGYRTLILRIRQEQTTKAELLQALDKIAMNTKRMRAAEMKVLARAAIAKTKDN